MIRLRRRLFARADAETVSAQLALVTTLWENGSAACEAEFGRLLAMIDECVEAGPAVWVGGLSPARLRAHVTLLLGEVPRDPSVITAGLRNAWSTVFVGARR